MKIFGIMIFLFGIIFFVAMIYARILVFSKDNGEMNNFIGKRPYLWFIIFVILTFIFIGYGSYIIINLIHK